MRASRTLIILEADTFDGVESNRILCDLVSINNLLAGYASSACMKLLNIGTWEIPVAPYYKRKEVVICKVQQAIIKVTGKSDAFVVPMK